MEVDTVSNVSSPSNVRNMSTDNMMKRAGLPCHDVVELKLKYKKLGKLGQGSYGKVQLAELIQGSKTGKETAHPKIRRALKKMKKCKAIGARQVREIQAAKTLQHPNIVKILEIYENKEKIVLAMEYAAFGDMYQFMLRTPSMNECAVRPLYRQILYGVYFCHRYNICHRDLKLENILVFSNYVVKIADFGFAREFAKDQLLDTFCGSTFYSSPEIVTQTPYRGPEADCWALGVILYAMLYNEMPFRGPSPNQFKEQICTPNIESPEAFFTSTQAAIILIVKILDVDPEVRPNIQEICAEKWLDIDCRTKCLEEAVKEAARCPIPSLAQPPQELENATSTESKRMTRKQTSRRKIDTSENRIVGRSFGDCFGQLCLGPKPLSFDLSEPSSPVKEKAVSLKDIHALSTSTANPEQKNNEPEPSTSKRHENV